MGKQLHPNLPTLRCTVCLKDGRTENREIKPISAMGGDLTVTFRRGFAGDRLTNVYRLGLKGLMNDTGYSEAQIKTLMVTYLDRLSGSLTYQLIKDQTDIWFEKVECHLNGEIIASLSQPMETWQAMFANVLRHEDVYVDLRDDSTTV